MSGKSTPDETRIAIAWQDPTMLQVGKNGLSEGVIEEAKRLLKSHEYIKVRLLRSTGVDRESKQKIFEEFCEMTDSQLAGIRGNTGVVYKLRK